MTTQKIQGACLMINYKRLREDLEVFDVSLKSFQESVDLAVEQQSKAYMPKMAMFASQEQIKQAYADGESDVKNMSWKDIYKLACDACMCHEAGFDTYQEERADAFAQATKTGAQEGK